MKKYYSVPVLEQVRMETEMPVMAGSGGSVSKSNVDTMIVGSVGRW